MRRACAWMLVAGLAGCAATTDSPRQSPGSDGAGSAGTSAMNDGTGSVVGDPIPADTSGDGTAIPVGSGDGDGAGTSIPVGDGSGGTGDGAGAAVDCEALPLPSNFDDVVATFEDGTGSVNHAPGRGGGFFTYNDGTGSMTPAPGALPDATSVDRCDSMYALCMMGSGFSDYGAGMGTDLGVSAAAADGGAADKAPFDASAYSGIAFWAKIDAGSTPVIKFSVKDGNTAPEGGVCDPAETSGDTACNDDWSKTLNLTTSWQPYTILFDELRQSGWGAAFPEFDVQNAYGIQWQVGPSLDFDLCIDDVVFVK